MSVNDKLNRFEKRQFVSSVKMLFVVVLSAYVNWTNLSRDKQFAHRLLWYSDT